MQIYLVGGAVRDQLLGLEVNDRDWLVVGASEKLMQSQGFIKVGKDFPVFLHPETHEEYALARKEIKVSPGYQGFGFDTSEDVRLIDDLIRRDLTINAMAIDQQGQLHDPFDGVKDIKARKLRHISHAFAEDPLRVLRVARFAARFHHLGFHIAEETLTIMRQITESGELQTLSSERIYLEINKALQTPNPAVFFDTLYHIGVFAEILPELAILLQHSRPFTALNHAIEYKEAHNYLLFTLAFYRLPIAQLEQLVIHIRLPNALKKLLNDVAIYSDFIATLNKHTSDEILIMLTKTNALRQPEHFKAIIRCITYIAEAENKSQHNVQLALDILTTLLGYNYSALTANVNNSKTIAKRVRNKRLELISGCLGSSSSVGEKSNE
ncbi:MAG: multifunctional CCA tRNA nucleotidyl transferase/2'3'-cyclic phosphodiesterase/2'nucleotidase/phosphatase [Francisellaceae bacterium]